MRSGPTRRIVQKRQTLVLMYKRPKKRGRDKKAPSKQEHRVDPLTPESARILKQPVLHNPRLQLLLRHSGRSLQKIISQLERNHLQKIQQKRTGKPRIHLKRYRLGEKGTYQPR